jgi:hypothetical protein
MAGDLNAAALLGRLAQQVGLSLTELKLVGAVQWSSACGALNPHSAIDQRQRKRLFAG